MSIGEHVANQHLLTNISQAEKHFIFIFSALLDFQEVDFIVFSWYSRTLQIIRRRDSQLPVIYKIILPILQSTKVTCKKLMDLSQTEVAAFRYGRFQIFAWVPKSKLIFLNLVLKNLK